jgi:hypothetical protein
MGMDAEVDAKTGVTQDCLVAFWRRGEALVAGHPF